MNKVSSPSSATTPTITYQSLVGHVLQHHRKQQKLEQSQMAELIGVSQSAFSRIESGATAISVAQLRKIAPLLGLQPGEILQQADELANNLRGQGVQVLDEKSEGVHPAAVMLGLGLLLALLSR